MRSGKGNAIVYGKIQVASETETLDTMFSILKKILNECEYPELKKDDGGEDLKKLEAELKGELIGSKSNIQRPFGSGQGQGKV